MKRPLAYCQKNHLLAWSLVENGETKIRYWAAIAGKGDNGRFEYKSGVDEVSVSELDARASVEIESFEIMCSKGHGAQIFFRLADLLPVVRGDSSPLTIKV